MSTGDVKVEEITSAAQRCELGEGPHWDIARQALYFVDIFGPSIFRLDFKTNKIYKATIKDDDSPIGFFIPVEGKTDEFVVGANRRVLLIRWDGEATQASIVKVIVEVDHAFPGNRINDGKVDPKGILFFGSMGDESSPDFMKLRNGSLYSFIDGLGAKSWKGDVGIGNGLTWDLKRKKFYYIDSLARDVKAWDYDAEKSTISNETVVVDFNLTHPGTQFVGDGMTIDENGTLYVATFFGSRILVVDPEAKKIVKEISIPTAQVTSLAFGGPHLDILFVTTAAKPKPQPAPADGLFKITGLRVKGLPMQAFKYY